MSRPKKRPEQRESTVTVSIRFPAALKDEAADLAEADRRSFNFYVVRAVEQAVERDQAARKGSR